MVLITKKTLPMPKSNYYRWMAAVAKSVNSFYRHSSERRNRPERIAKYRASKRDANLVKPNNHFAKQKALNNKGRYGFDSFGLPF